MFSMPGEERQWADVFPSEGIRVGELALAMHECPAQEGLVFAVNCKDKRCAIWLPLQLWNVWCEGLLGIADMSVIDPQLLFGIAEWGLSPLLHASEAVLCPGERFVLCSNLPHHVALTVSWRVEKYDFQTMLFDWPSCFLKAVAEKVTPAIRHINPMPPVSFPVYIGWSQLTMVELESINTGVGVRLHCFGDARAGCFAIELPGNIGARISLTAENTMKFNELVQDIETLLAEDNETPGEETAGLINLDELPQILLFEVGRASVELGRLRQLKEGDILPASGHFVPEVTLRLNGRAVGQGELVACGNAFLVRIIRWYLQKDTVNT